MYKKNLLKSIENALKSKKTQKKDKRELKKQTKSLKGEIDKNKLLEIGIQLLKLINNTISKGWFDP